MGVLIQLLILSYASYCGRAMPDVWVRAKPNEEQPVIRTRYVEMTLLVLNWWKLLDNYGKIWNNLILIGLFDNLLSVWISVTDKCTLNSR